MIGRVYKIIGGDEVYIGSTLNTLKKRLKWHKSGYKGWKKGKKNNCGSYVLFDKYGIDNCKMILIKDYEVVDRKHLGVYETLWIYKTKKVVNQNIPFRVNFLWVKQYLDKTQKKRSEKQKKYYKSNKDQISRKYKQYYENNKGKILEQGKQKIRCETCNCEVSKSHFSRHAKTQKHIEKLNTL